ncbi:LuxR C-terminal-related transcriptional regulator [Nocardia sp. NPDC051990]|uniref:LuxR C-terminal-related transcriptional regulator n=1 Tax=Nocardia sp. NPDC051990 TaxID=3155285 RepID=UPI003422FCA1
MEATAADRLEAAIRLRTALAAVPGAGARHEMSSGRALFELADAVPYRHAALSRWDPRVGRHVTAASFGYPPKSIQMVEGSMHTDPLFPRVRGPIPVRLRDLPDRERCGPIFDQVIRPQKYSDGLTQCLFARDGRYIGMLNLSTTGGQRIDQQSVVTVTLLAETLADVLDPIAPRPIHSPIGVADSALVIDADGSLQALTGDQSLDKLFARHTTGNSLARAAARARRPADHLFVGNDVAMQVSMEPVRSGATLVVYRSIDPPLGLTMRELEVLAKLPTGASNATIGRQLGIGAATVATHLERVLRKIDVPNRTAAAATAAQWHLTQI